MYKSVLLSQHQPHCALTNYPIPISDDCIHASQKVVFICEDCLVELDAELEFYSSIIKNPNENYL